MEILAVQNINALKPEGYLCLKDLACATLYEYGCSLMIYVVYYRIQFID